MKRSVWLFILCAAVLMTLSAGIRQGLGLFLRPISLDLDMGRQVFGLALAIQTLVIGLSNPFAGILADRYGHWRVALAGAALYAVSLLLASQSQGPTSITLSFGLLMGLALSAVSMSVMFGAAARVVAPEKRTFAFGLITSGGSFGQFLVVPFTMNLLTEIGWRETCAWLSVGALLIMLLARGLGTLPPLPAATRGKESASLGEALRSARQHRGFVLLKLSYFVCGFHVALIMTHLPAFFLDRGLPPLVSAQAYALIGLFNIFGCYFFGWAGTRWPKHLLLVGIYSARAVIFIPLLLLPTTPALAYGFSIIMGFIFLGTVPPTSGIVAQLFGVRHLTTLFGISFLSHQLGGFFGSWLAGLIFDHTGSYDLVWMMAIALGVIAAALCLPIDERPASDKLQGA